MITEDELSVIHQKVEALQRHHAIRDFSASQVRAVRHGDFDQIAPGIFPQDWPRPVAANIVDNMARDFAAKLAPLPSINCSATATMSDAARDRADKRTKIARNYVVMSRLAAQMPEAADGYNCYGMAVFCVEPDMDAKLPLIRAEDSAYIYPIWNRKMETMAVAKVWYAYAQDLQADYPYLPGLIKEHPGALVDGDRLKIVKWSDDKVCVTYLPELGRQVLESYANPIGKCLYVAVPRPSGKGTTGEVIRGQYDDLVWPQLARNEFQLLALEAADKAVRAPIVVPPDVTEVPFGPDAIIPTAQPQGVGRLKIDVPQSAFSAMQWLREDMQLGGMSPPARSGQSEGSIVTGAGVDALMEGYSTQLAQAQEMMKFALQKVIELCFLIDEKLWPNLKKSIRGQDEGIPYEVSYIPSKDINGDHSIDIQYGFLSGLDANRSLIFILQAFGAGLLSQDYAMRNLPAAFNVGEEQRKIEVEHVRKALLEGAVASAQAIPQMAMQGADPSNLMKQLAQLAKNIIDGDTVEDAAQKAFTPPTPPPAAPGAAPGPSPSGPDAGAPGSDAAGGGMQPGQPGSTDQGAPGGTASPPQAPPDLMRLMAGISNGGKSNLTADVRRNMPVSQP